ncbi:MAG: hypothetical protein U0517_02060 [Candidatus Andersenbacteria bacterium]
MPRQKGSAKRKGSAKKDSASLPYNMVIFYVIIGLIMGMAVGALALLYIARVQNDYQQTLNDTSAQILQYTPRIR